MDENQKKQPFIRKHIAPAYQKYIRQRHKGKGKDIDPLDTWNLLAQRGYEIIRNIGEGAFGCVFLAHTSFSLRLKLPAHITSDHNLVVIKEADVRKQQEWGYMTEDQAKRETLKEVSRMIRLRHRHILQLLDAFWIHPHFLYIVLEYSTFGSLYDYIRKIEESEAEIVDALFDENVWKRRRLTLGRDVYSRLDIQIAERWIKEVLLALSFTSRQGFTYTDVHSGNVFICRDDERYRKLGLNLENKSNVRKDLETLRQTYIKLGDFGVGYTFANVQLNIDVRDGFATVCDEIYSITNMTDAERQNKQQELVLQVEEQPGLNPDDLLVHFCGCDQQEIERNAQGLPPIDYLQNLIIRLQNEI